MQRRRKTTKEERVCGICSRSFNKAEHLARHIRSHTKEKPYQCQVCKKVYTRQYVATLLTSPRTARCDGTI